MAAVFPSAPRTPGESHACTVPSRPIAQHPPLQGQTRAARAPSFASCTSPSAPRSLLPAIVAHCTARVFADKFQVINRGESPPPTPSSCLLGQDDRAAGAAASGLRGTGAAGSRRAGRSMRDAGKEEAPGAHLDRWMLRPDALRALQCVPPSASVGRPSHRRHQP